MAIFQKALFGSSSEKFKTTEKDQLTLPFLKSIDDINNQNDFTEENQ
jgi:hypothetical protein